MTFFFGFGAEAFFCFFVLGGVFERCEPLSSESRSGAESSSSVSGFGRFFEATGLTWVFSVVCDNLDAALGAAVFFIVGLGAVAALALGFAGIYSVVNNRDAH